MFRLIISAVLLMVGSSSINAQVWSEWETKNSVAKFGSFMVIKQPGSNPSFCYIKQSYEDVPGKMELTVKVDEIPYLTHPFYRGMNSDLIYQVDDGPVRFIKASVLNSRRAIPLDKSVTKELVSGRRLKLRHTPEGYRNMEQVLPLNGFKAALRNLGSNTCK